MRFWHRFVVSANPSDVSLSFSTLFAAGITLLVSALGFAAWIVKQMMETTRIIAVLVERVDAHEIDIQELRTERQPYSPAPRRRAPKST